MARPEHSTQSEICTPKSKIGPCERRGVGKNKRCIAQVALTRGYARFMRGYARQSAVRRANARFELFRVSVPDLHQIAPNCTIFEACQHDLIEINIVKVLGIH